MSSLLARLRSFWHGLRRGGGLDADMADEFRLHVELRAEDLMRHGLSRREALRRAQLEFGSVERYREEGRQARGLRLPDELRGDVRYALRSLARSRGFTAVAVLTLALGVGATAAVFGLVNATLLRALPFAEPDRLVTLYQTQTEAGREPQPRRWSYAEYAALRAAVQSFSHVAAYAADDVNLASGAGEPERVRAEMVSAAYFVTLGVQPLLGRAFSDEEDATPGEYPVALLSHDLWTTRFAADPSILGAQIRLNGVPLSVIGVLPRDFGGLTGEAHVWITHALAPIVGYGGHLTTPQHFISVVGRLAPGASLAQARAEVATRGRAAAAAARQQSGGGAAGEWHVSLLRLDEARRDRATLRAQLVLGGAVLFVLLIAVANVSALLLARSVGRAREMALRTALGAGRLRLVRLVIAEAGVLAALGGALGLGLAAASLRLLGSFAPLRFGSPVRGGAALTTFATPALDWRVATFAFLCALGAALAAALIPALRAARGDLASPLRVGARGHSIGVGTLRRPTALAAAATAQVACAFLLLAGAGQLITAFERLRSTEPGFDATGVVTLRLNAPERLYGGDAAAPLLEQILARVEPLPGVAAASVAFCVPYMRCSSTPLYIAGEAPPADPPIVGRHYVGPDHFRTLRIPLLAGRTLSAEDRPGRPRVAVINETAARRFWPGENPIGRRVHFGSGGGFASPDSLTEIVGIVGDVLYGAPGEPTGPDFYTSYLQFTWPAAMLLVRTTASPDAIVPALRQAIASVDADVPIYDVSTMQQRAAAALAAERFALRSLAGFAALGLLLASIGVYGVMAYSVAQRRREIGIRIAIGATAGQVLRFIVAQALAMATVGLVIGAAAAVASTRVLAALVPNADAAEPRVFLAAIAVFLLVALAAAAMPARAAAAVDPLETLAAD